MKDTAARLTLAFATSSLFKSDITKSQSKEISALLKMDRLSAEYARLLSAIYSFSTGQDLVHVAAQALSALGAFYLPDSPPANDEKSAAREALDKLKAAFDKQLLIAITRYHRLGVELNTLCDTLDSAGVDYIPLKGSVIREHYPDPKVRLSCDIDILVKKSDLDKCDEILTSQGLTRTAKNAHDVSYFTKSGIHLELHYELIESFTNKSVAEVLQRVWNYATPVADGSHRHALSPGMYYFYHLAHMAKHLINGGLGIRAFMDISVMKHAGLIDLDEAAALLEAGGLTKFSDTALALCDAWFGGASHTELSLRLEAKALDLSIYGTKHSFARMRGAKSGSKLKYLLSRIFYTYEMLCNSYPQLEGHRWKTPFYQIKRWSNLIFKRGRLKNSIGEVLYLTSMSSKDMNENSNLIKALGIERST